MIFLALHLLFLSFFCVCAFCFLLTFFLIPTFLWVLEHFLELQFDLSVVILNVSFCTAFSDCSQYCIIYTQLILSVGGKWRNLASIYILLPSPIYNIFILNISSMYILNDSVLTSAVTVKHNLIIFSSVEEKSILYTFIFAYHILSSFLIVLRLVGWLFSFFSFLLPFNHFISVLKT